MTREPELTGSTNWTADSFTHMENVVLVVPGSDLAAAFTADFEQLWRRGTVDGTGRLDDRPASLVYRGQPCTARALFAPERGPQMSALIAARIDAARRRVHVCSPVITSMPILGELAERAHAGGIELTIAVDGPQLAHVVQQWRGDGRSAWKLPLIDALRRSGRLSEKPSAPYTAPGPHDYLHAKLVVADDSVITGSFNCSRSGETNAENVVELHSAPMADEAAAYATAVFERYRGQLPGGGR